jgi:hypothetical protein
MARHKVEQGDCISSIARRYGLFWRTVWDHAENADLQQRRQDPNLLLPGDEVFIPDVQTREQSGATETRHKFRKKGEPAKLIIRLLRAGEPVANEQYILDIDGVPKTGTTSAEGRLEQPIPPDASAGRLQVGTGDSMQELLLDLGSLDPVTEISGIQARLNNLGFDCGAVDGIAGPRTRAALAAFQETYQLQVTRDTDLATQDRLRELYGS